VRRQGFSCVPAFPLLSLPEFGPKEVPHEIPLDILEKTDEVNFRWLEAAQDVQALNLGSKERKRCRLANTSSLIGVPSK